MRLLSSRVIKNYKVCMGAPFRIKEPSVIKNTSIKNDYLKDDYLKDNYLKGNQEDSNNVFAMKYEEESGYFENSIDVEEIIQLAQSEASAIIKEAEDEARSILEKSEDDAQKSKIEIKKAKEKGYEDGRKEAKIEAKKEYEEKIKEAEYIKEKMIEEYIQILNNVESDIVDVILDISKKVLHTEIIQNKNIIFNLVREAINNCTYKSEVILKVSPEEYDHIMQNKDELDLILGDIENFEVRKDPLLQNGDCIVETPCGYVDTSMNTKLNKIEKAFKRICKTQNIDIKNVYAYTREEY